MNFIKKYNVNTDLTPEHGNDLLTYGCEYGAMETERYVA